ncbi:hypothetical protein E1H99_12250 [Enterococcus hirae]|nr:hypothetical protein E1H99_12250 [Enterococcus hirae]
MGLILSKKKDPEMKRRKSLRDSMRKLSKSIEALNEEMRELRKEQLLNDYKKACEKKKIDQQIEKAAQKAERTRIKNLPVKSNSFLHFR